MRTKPLLGRKAWFGPKRMGWGLAPVSAEGWAVTVAGVAAMIGLAVLTRRAWVTLPVVAALVTVVFVKGTSMGGRRERDEFTRQDRRDS